MTKAENAIKAGRLCINSTCTYTYLDYPHSKINLEKIYSFEPIPKTATAKQAKFIIGGEAPIWTEMVTQPEVDFQVFPRLTAFSEVLWSPKETRDFNDFSNRLDTHLKRLTTMKVNYYHKDPGQKIGGWNTGELPPETKILEMDVTKFIKPYEKAGFCWLNVQYDSGENDFLSEWAALSVDGKEVFKDDNAGFSGQKRRASSYILIFPPDIGKAKTCTVRLAIKAKDGTDSAGSIWLASSPSESCGL